MVLSCNKIYHINTVADKVVVLVASQKRETVMSVLSRNYLFVRLALIAEWSSW